MSNRRFFLSCVVRRIRYVARRRPDVSAIENLRESSCVKEPFLKNLTLELDAVFIANGPRKLLSN